MLLALTTSLLLQASPSPAAVAPPASTAPIGYRLVVASPMATTVHVEIDLPDLPPPQVLVIPRAVPMGYGEEPYDRFVSNVKAFAADGKPLDVARGEGPRFVMTGAGPVRRVAYDVDVARMEREVLSASDSSKKRPGYLGLLGYSIFGTMDGLEDRPVTLRVRAPNGWPVFSTLSPSQPRIRKFTSGSAPSYYALADSQLAMGPALRVRRLVGTPILFVVAYVEDDFDIDSFARLSREALDATVDYFACVPFPHYSVLVEAVKPVSKDHQYGFSMEHLDSTSMTFASDKVPTAASTERENEGFLFNL
ncbi:MAG TPA: hypothetical protein VGR00_02140, partial [Thermoanaerobaculia bacterium]|nr:hypothetical protein [Thermoanaerobaculia bacterium]